MTTKLAIGMTFVVALAVAACNGTGEQPGGAATGQPAQTTQAGPSAAPSTAKDHKHHGKDDACGEDHGAATVDTAATGTDPDTGKPMQLIGAKLTGVEVVKIVDLAARPDDFVGKTVRVEGDVLGMCHHKRAWFAMQDEGDRSGGFVRVVTGPKFLVPAGSVGKKARVEGTVEVVEVPPRRAKYFAKSHNMGDPEKITGPVKRP
ncbi:MAG: hypothetical protein JRI68_25735, partial [Deltaproteobacteria bacterium]|nr:hypothetical protein [Deltaproteobacteria bacterium]